MTPEERWLIYTEVLRNMVALCIEMRARFDLTPAQEAMVKREVFDAPEGCFRDMGSVRLMVMAAAEKAIGSKWAKH